MRGKSNKISWLFFKIAFSFLNNVIVDTETLKPYLLFTFWLITRPVSKKLRVFLFWLFHVFPFTVKRLEVVCNISSQYIKCITKTFYLQNECENHQPFLHNRCWNRSSYGEAGVRWSPGQEDHPPLIYHSDFFSSELPWVCFYF